MFATQKVRIKGLTQAEYEILCLLHRYAKNLYNVALYALRQHFFATERLLSFNKLYHQCKTNENYHLIQAGVSQQILKSALGDMKSFLALSTKAALGQYPAEKVKIPKYLPKDGYSQLLCSTNAITVHDGYFQIPMSNRFMQEHPGLTIKIRVPDRMANQPIREVRLNPLHHARFLEAEFVYKTADKAQPVGEPETLALDLGINTLAAGISTTGTAFLIDGKRLKSVNQWYNKERSRLQSMKDLQGIKGETDKLALIAYNRENFMRDYLSKAGHLILQHCLDNKIGRVVVGVNPGWKQAINIGHVNNQNFVQIPFWKFRRFLAYLCEKNGIEYVEITESYTSKASFLDRDLLPEFDPEHTEKYVFSGKRVKRGLYRSANGQAVNADLNGAANILRKACPGIDLSRVSHALCLNPIRLYPLATIKRRTLKSKAAA
ncbi:putative transposase [Peptococcaceae bacterium CEB3]|nr:putative transposase [Peptococcaceae bacterium CEB3]